MLKITIDPKNATDCSHSFAIHAFGGVLALWAMECPENLLFVDYFKEKYGPRNFDIGAMPEGSQLDGEDNYIFIDGDGDEDGEQDPPLPPILVFEKGDETLIIYRYAICAFKRQGHPTHFARLD